MRRPDATLLTAAATFLLVEGVTLEGGLRGRRHAS
jgi:hypothetical protein